MLNNETFLKRLEEIMAEYDLSASSLADKIGVGRSSISHLLSGRNNPSLDFILRVKSAFPAVDLYWLLGIEQKEATPPLDLFTHPSDTVKKNKNKSAAPTPIKSASAIEQIVIFYTDGSFKAYTEDKAAEE